MPRPRFENLPPEKRASILNVAGEEFARHGYQGASLNAILAAAEVSKGAFYYYFDDKADLFATVLEYAIEAVLTAVEFQPEKLTADTFWAAWEGMGHHTTAFLREHPWVIELGRLVHSAPAGSELAGISDELRHRSGELIRAVLQRGQELGQVRTDLPMELLAPLLMSIDQAADTWFFTQWTEHDMEALGRYRRMLTDLMRRVLRPAPQEEQEG